MRQLLPSLFLLAACASTPRPERARVELLALHAAQQRAHLDEDAAGLVALLDEGYCELRDGRILHPTHAELEARFRSYFDAVEFLAWDDLEAPRIELADDGTRATMAVQKLVRTREAVAGEARVTRTVYAWLASCARTAQGWRITTLASTRAPDGVATSLAALRHALGGAARIDALADVRASYACRGPVGAYRIELELPRARPWRVAWLFPGEIPAEFELDGHAGWSRAADGTRTPLAPEEAAMVRAHAFPRLVLAPEEFLPELEHAGTRLEQGRTLERLVARAPGTGALELDLANDRLARLELVDARTDPPAKVTVRFESWREVDGLLLPERVVAVDGKGDWVMELATAELEFDPASQQ